MRKLLSKFKVLVPAIVCLLALTMVLFTGCGEDTPQPHVHNLQKVDGTAATCTTTGVKEHWHCEGCDKDFLLESGGDEVSAADLVIAIDPLAHDYDFANTAFDFALKAGSTDEYVCTATTTCRHNAEHKFTVDAVSVSCNVTPATCENAGQKLFSATFENTEYGTNGVVTKTEVIDALGHNYGSLVAEEPATCTTDGTKEHYTCSNCHKNFDKDHKEIANLVIPARHDLSYNAQVNPSCSAEGTKEHWHCSVCNKNFGNAQGTTELTDISIAKISHSFPSDSSEYKYDYDSKTYYKECRRCGAKDTATAQQAGSEQYPFLANDEASLMAAIAEGGHVKLANNIVVSGVIRVTKDIVVDLDHKTISYTQIEADNNEDKTARKNYCIFGVTAGEACFINGTIEYKVQEGLANAEQGRVISVENDAQLALSNMTITSDKRGICVFDNTKTLITSSTITSTEETLSSNNVWGPSAEGNCTLKVVGCTITSTDLTAMFIPSYVEVSIESSTIKGKTSAVYMMMGSLTVDAQSGLECTATSFTARTTDIIGKSGPGENGYDGATIVIRSNYYYDKTCKSNKLALNIANWNNVRSASNVKVAVYNWTIDSSFISAAKEAGNTVTDQMVEIAGKLSPQSSYAKFFAYNGTEIEQMKVFTYTSVEEDGEVTKPHVMKILATKMTFSGTPAGAETYTFVVAGFTNGELEEVSNGMAVQIGEVIKAQIGTGDDAFLMQFRLKDDQGNLAAVIDGCNMTDVKTIMFCDDGICIIRDATAATEEEMFATYNYTKNEAGEYVVYINDTTKTFKLLGDGAMVACTIDRSDRFEQFDSVNAAIKASNDGDTIVLSSDIVLDNYIGYVNTDNPNKKITLDLNGMEISCKEGVTAMFGIVGGEITITNGKIIGKTNVLNNCIEIVGNNYHTKVVLTETLTVESSGSCVCIYGQYAELETEACLTSTSERFCAITGSGDTGDNVKSVKILGGEITSSYTPAVYIPNGGAWEISGGRIEGTTAVYVKSGTVKISGDVELIATSVKKDFQHKDSGCEDTGEALVIEACGYPGGDPVVTINGGRFYVKADETSEESAAHIGIYNYNGHTVSFTNNVDKEAWTINNQTIAK